MERKWTSKEVSELRRLAPLGLDLVAAALERSIPSVKLAAARHRISLRRKGETRGLILGQPRGTSFREDPALSSYRDAVLAGEADPARVERRAAAEGGSSLEWPVTSSMRGERRHTCPNCGLRPQEIETTGLCEDCHLRKLASAHRMEAETMEASRAVEAARQRKARAKARENGGK